MKIELSIESVHYKKTTIDLEEYDGTTKEEWELMSKTDQENWLDENVIDKFDDPYWVISEFTTIPPKPKAP